MPYTAKARHTRSVQTAPNTGTVADLDVAGTAANTATTVTYAVGGTTTTRRWSPNASNAVNQPVPGAPSTASGVGYRDVTGDSTTESVEYAAGTWTLQARLTKSGQTVAANIDVRVTMIVYRVTSSGAHIVELGRVQFANATLTATALTLSGGFTTAAESNFDPADKVQVELYVTTLTAGTPAAPAAAVSIHLVANEVTANATKIATMPTFIKIFPRSATASAIGIASGPVRSARLAAKVALGVGVTSRLLYVKPTARSATGIGLALVPVKYARLAAKSATAIGIATRQANHIRLAAKVATAIGVPTAARRLVAWRAQSASATGVASYTRAVIAVRAFAATASGIATRGANYARLAAKSATAIGIATRQANHIRLAAKAATAIGLAAQTRLIRFTRAATAVGSASMVRAVITIRGFIAAAVGVASGRLGIGMDAYDRATRAEPPPANPTKAIAGVVRDSSGTPVVGATVKLFRQADDKLLGTQVSGAGGTFSFPRDTADTATYYTVAYLGGTPQTHGTSDRDLVPA